MADIVVTVAVVVCRIPSGTPGSRYQSLRKKCNRIVRSSGSKSMSSSKSLLIGDHFGLGMMIGMIGFDKCMPCSNIHIIHTRAHTYARKMVHGGLFRFWRTRFRFSVCAVYFSVFGQNRVRDKIAYLRPWFVNGNGWIPFVVLFFCDLCVVFVWCWDVTPRGKKL